MPWKLIFFIISLILVILFIGSNLGNACSINFFWIANLKDVPIFMTIFISFALGVLVTVPFVIFRVNSKNSKKNEVEKKSEAKKNEQKKAPDIVYETDSKKESKSEKK